jgi:predicted outer membrane protein
VEDYLVTLLEMGRQYQARIAEVNQDTHLSADARRQQIRDASRDFDARYKPERTGSYSNWRKTTIGFIRRLMPQKDQVPATAWMRQKKRCRGLGNGI